ncbi:hypothetical protein E2C01_017725 [Portunus trituberculatus]|uniref:Uncharacterized protein n=1 Tax=Portunus trituberculatus TaxID=210409 RepID=A0A5B7DTA7_PORTR|nr:hypothetical protein [Portunus trituberculatus]
MQENWAGTERAPDRESGRAKSNGHVAGSKPWVSLCDFASPIRNLTPKMKKGFKLLYQNGCDCQVRTPKVQVIHIFHKKLFL